MRLQRALPLTLLVALALPTLAVPLSASASDITVISKKESKALAAEGKQQLRDAEIVHKVASKTLGFSKKQIKHGMTPSMVRKGEFVLKLKDGTHIAFPWFRIGFAENKYANTGKPKFAGPNAAETNKGGIRVHKGVTQAEVQALALKMDRKLRLSGDMLAGHAVRGAKGGVGIGRVLQVGSKYKDTLKKGNLVDPASKGIDTPALMRLFARSYIASGGQVGIGADIQAGDVNTKQPEMMALAREYARLSGKRTPSIGVSGKELVLRKTKNPRTNGAINPNGGIQYRSVSTGEGVAMAARLAAKTAKVKINKATVVSQGWGEVGRAFGDALSRDGARVIAIEERWIVDGKTRVGTLKHPKGAKATHAETVTWLSNIADFRSQWAEHLRDPSKPAPNLRTFRGGALWNNAKGKSAFKQGMSVFTVKADIVGVNALGGTVTKDAVKDLLKAGTHLGKSKVYVEGANLATTTGGARALDKAHQKIVAVPGDLANLGGVHVSNIEALQNSTGKPISNSAAARSLQSVMDSAYSDALSLAKKHKISLRAGIELLATQRMMRTSLNLSKQVRADLHKVIFGSPRQSLKIMAKAPTPKQAKQLKAKRKATSRKAGKKKVKKLKSLKKAKRVRG